MLGLAAALAATLLATITRYCFFGDELYFRLAGQHLDWSFPDQPPLLPLIADTMDRIFPVRCWHCVSRRSCAPPPA